MVYLFLPKFTIMRQPHLKLINYLSLHIELTPVEKNSVIIGTINCWNKTQNMLRNQSLKSLYPNKIKTVLTKRCIDKY